MLVNFNADAVSGAVGEIIVKPFRFKVIARGFVNVRRFHAGAHRFDAFIVCLQNRFVNVLEIVSGIAESERPCDVAAIALVFATEVDRNGHAFFEAGVARVSVRLAGVCAECDDRRERKTVRAELTHLIFEFRRKLFFGNARFDFLSILVKALSLIAAAF